MPFNAHGKPCGSGRSYKKYTYTTKDVARLTGLSLTTIRIYKSRGLLDMTSLSSVVDFIVSRKSAGDNSLSRKKAIKNTYTDILSFKVIDNGDDTIRIE